MYFLLVLVGALASTHSFPATPNLSKCLNNTFFCTNFECLPWNKRCDGFPDCADGSDERGCDFFHCTQPNFFRCKNQKCIRSVYVCDLQNDCEDLSDEENCTNPRKRRAVLECSKSQWRCSPTLCIPKELLCDGGRDCSDESDETIACSKTQECHDGFKCKNGYCISKKWRCDGQDDCRDNSDEEGCGTKNLTTWGLQKLSTAQEVNGFKCKNGYYISQKWRCDGDYDCADNDDEEGCVTRNLTSCSPLEFRCQSGACIPKHEQCDNKNDCGDNSDELQILCPKKAPVSQTNSSATNFLTVSQAPLSQTNSSATNLSTTNHSLENL